MIDPDFEDFVLDGGYDLLFDVDVQCPHCDRIIASNERVEWVDKQKNIFKCPECNRRIEFY